MKRLMFLVLAAVLLVPAVVAAQITYEGPKAETLVDANTLGDGWELSSNQAGGSALNPWDRRLIYYGPSGASLVIEAFTLDDSMSLLTEKFRSLYVAWIMQAFDIAEDDSTVPVMNQTEDADLEDVSDVYRIDGTNADNALPIGFGFYGSLTHQIVITIHVEGTVNGLTGVAATDYVAGLYFAALSGQ